MNSENSNEITCPSCGFRSQLEAKFCGGCGESFGVQLVCPECGAANDATHRYCVICGYAFIGKFAISSAPSGGKPKIRLTLGGISSRAVLLIAIFAALLAVIAIAAFLLLRGANNIEGPGPGSGGSILDSVVSSVSFARVEPDPSGLVVRSEPTEHHAVDVVSNGSAVIIAESASASTLIVHNDNSLVEQNGCAAVSPTPEGDYRILLIKPEDIRGEWRGRFYIVGCEPGEATIKVESGGSIVATYSITVAEQ